MPPGTAQPRSPPLTMHKRCPAGTAASRSHHAFRSRRPRALDATIISICLRTRKKVSRVSLPIGLRASSVEIPLTDS